MSTIGFGFSGKNQEDYDKLRESISNIAKDYDYKLLYNLGDVEILDVTGVVDGIRAAYEYLKWDFIAIVVAPSTDKEPSTQITYGIDDEIDNFIIYNGVRPPFFDFLKSICNLLSPFTNEVSFFFCFEWDPKLLIRKREGSLNELIRILEYNSWYLVLYRLEGDINQYEYDEDCPLIFTVKL